MENINEYDFTVPIVEDATVIKQRGLELQNKTHKLLEDLAAAERAKLSVETAMKWVEDKSLLIIESDLPAYGLNEKTNISTKKTYARTKINILVKYITSESEEVEANATYYQLRKVSDKSIYIYNFLRNKLNELQSAIDACRFYPTKDGY